MNLSQKSYTFVYSKPFYNRNIYFIKEKKTIKCLGGENMQEEKEIVFLSPEDIPRLSKGNTGRKWSEIFDKIPLNKVMQMTTEEYGSAPNIRTQVGLYNKEAKKKVLTVTQRTDKETEKVIVYVMRVAQ